MESLEQPRFRTETGKRIYQYVERHGTAARHRTLSALDVPAEEFRAELEWLVTNGYLEDDGGTLRVDLDAGSVERHESDGLQFAIRPARQEDFESVVDAIRDVTDERTYVVAESVAERLLYEDAVNRHNTVESRVFFVATDDGEIVGWTHLDLPQVDKLQRTAKLTVGVRGGYRRRGVGSQLLGRATDWAGANGYRKLYNSVPSTNDSALAFLEAHGWNTEGIRRNHYTIDDDPVDEVMMAYTF